VRKKVSCWNATRNQLGIIDACQFNPAREVANDMRMAKLADYEDFIHQLMDLNHPFHYKLFYRISFLLKKIEGFIHPTKTSLPN
jgi:hypothetical protein